jgi:hypothetical protein
MEELTTKRKIIHKCKMDTKKLQCIPSETFESISMNSLRKHKFTIHNIQESP